jgi:hypothetical protein
MAVKSQEAGTVQCAVSTSRALQPCRACHVDGLLTSMSSRPVSFTGCLTPPPVKLNFFEVVVKVCGPEHNKKWSFCLHSGYVTLSCGLQELRSSCDHCDGERPDDEF